jgi:hypothetical protein
MFVGPSYILQYIQTRQAIWDPSKETIDVHYGCCNLQTVQRRYSRPDDCRQSSRSIGNETARFHYCHTALPAPYPNYGEGACCLRIQGVCHLRCTGFGLRRHHGCHQRRQAEYVAGLKIRASAFSRCRSTIQLTRLLAREPANRPVGNTTNQSTELLTSSLTPIKQQRPFSSGSPGVTTWYSSASPQKISLPPSTITPEVGELYIHHNRLEDVYDVWLYGQDLKWKRVTDIEKVCHPIIDDRVLSMRANGTPNWITAASYMTIRGRRGKVRFVE